MERVFTIYDPVKIIESDVVFKHRYEAEIYLEENSDMFSREVMIVEVDRQKEDIVKGEK